MLKSCLDAVAHGGNPQDRAASLRHKSEQWWYFLDYPQVPPDNNRAERSLRLAVTKRKVAGGSRSWNGFERSATILTCDSVKSC
ncbi:MAG: transposase [Moorea sp. SIO3E2]|nr:transposase [Moorena sp. SIO3E2]